MNATRWLVVTLLLLFSSGTELQALHRLRHGKLAGDCRNCTSCGVSNKNRIIGGQNTSVNNYPWMGMLLLRQFFICGASLINNKYMLTAAHCVANSFVPDDYEIRLLQERLNSPQFQSLVRKPSQITAHPSYNAKTLENDIALIKLSVSVKFNDAIHPVCLPTENSLGTSDRIGVIIGWGATQEGGEGSSQLQEVTVPILTTKKCQEYGLHITRTKVCAGEEKGGKDSCQGDSGGPLHVLDHSKYIIVGIVSYGFGCGRERSPGVYTKVSVYNTWIRRNTQDACSC